MQSTKQLVECFCQWQLKVPAGRARSDCAHEQVAKLDPVSRTAGMDCEYPIDLMRACCNEWKYMDSVMKGSKDWK